jgi:hypothetical protein
MIKERCSCGATFEVIQGFVDREDQAVAIWRREHKHDWDSHIQNVISDISPKYILGEDYVYNGEGEPVWISSTHNPPPFWWQSVDKAG